MPHILTVGARSRLVTALGCLALLVALLSGLAGVVGLLQAAGWWTEGEGRVAPALASHRLEAGALGLLLALGTVVVAVGLIRRLEWARRVFVAILLATLLLQLGGLLLQQAVLLWATWAGAAAPAPAALGDWGAVTPGLWARLALGFAQLGAATQAAMALASLALCALLAWLVWRLQQPLVRQEFA